MSNFAMLCAPSHRSNATNVTAHSCWLLDQQAASQTDQLLESVTEAVKLPLELGSGWAVASPATFSPLAAHQGVGGDPSLFPDRMILTC